MYNYCVSAGSKVCVQVCTGAHQLWICIHEGNKFRFDDCWLSSARQEAEEVPEVPLSRVFKLNSPEWPFIFLGCIGSIISGAIQPGFAVIFAEILGVSILHCIRVFSWNLQH